MSRGGNHHPEVASEDMVALLEGGWQVQEIAEKYGVTGAAVVLRIRNLTGLNPLQYLYTRGWVAQNCPPEMAAEIAEAYRNEPRVTVTELSKRFKRTQSTIAASLEAHGIVVDPQRSKRFIDEEMIEEIAELYRAGESCPAIGRQYGVTERTIRRALDAAGVKRRARGRRPTCAS